MKNPAEQTIESQYPLLPTKLYIPQLRKDSVRRSHLVDRLNGQIGRKLILVSAPAGFGKTTLISEWISSLKAPIAWLTLDAYDTDPFHFIHYLAAALMEINPKIGEKARSILQSQPRSSIDFIMTSLVKDIAEFPGRIMLVLDDYHLIDSEAIHGIVAYLLEYLPDEKNLVISTRADPPLPLARLRVNKEMMELRAAELCFSEAEIALFINQTLGLNVSSQDISRLGSRTEGWIAGLQMAGLSMQGRDDIPAFIESFAGDDRHIVDYLAEEVLNRQSEEIQTFLLQTSILKQLSEPLCDLVVDVNGSQGILNELEQANLFIVPLDNKRHWYRYHHLFSDLLRQRLQQADAGLVSELHTRASKWYEKNSLRNEAVEHAISAGDYKRAAYLIGEYTESLFKSGDHYGMLKWFRKLPDHFIHQDPELSFLNAWMLFQNSKYDAAEENLGMLESLIGVGSDETEDPTLEIGRSVSLKNKELLGKAAAIRSYIAAFRGQADNIVKFSNRALKYLPDGTSIWRIIVTITSGDAHFLNGELEAASLKYMETIAVSQKAGVSYLSLLAGVKLAIAKNYQGDAVGAIAIFEQILQTFEKRGLQDAPVVAGIYLRWGEILIDLAKLDEAERLTQKGLALLEKGADPYLKEIGSLCLAKFLFIKGDLKGAEEIIQNIEKTKSNPDTSVFIAQALDVMRIHIWLKQGKLKQTRQWMQDRLPTSDRKSCLPRESDKILFARILLAHGQWDEALDLVSNQL
ncbi:MAG: hypothetical protein GY850_09895, partial [bacterium]|nr:hypothetical protein [bacterium]